MLYIVKLGKLSLIVSGVGTTRIVGVVLTNKLPYTAQILIQEPIVFDALLNHGTDYSGHE
jgi:hypothetical protein